MHRGCKEADIVLGSFAESCIDSLTEPELLIYEGILNHNDSDLMDYYFGHKPVPKELDGELFQKIMRFSAKNR